MTISFSLATLILVAASLLFSGLTFLATFRRRDRVSIDQWAQLLRNESDRIRQTEIEQDKLLRQELSDNLRGFQETTFSAFRELGESLRTQVQDFGARLDAGIKTLAERTSSMTDKLDQDVSRLDQQGQSHREVLRKAIEVKLDDAIAKQNVASQGLREEVLGNFHALSASVIQTLTETTLKQGTTAKELREEMGNSFQTLGLRVSETLNQVSEHQRERLESVTQALGQLSRSVEERLNAIRVENAAKLDEMRKTVDEKLQNTLDTRLSESFARVVEQLERVHSGIGEMQTLAAGVGDLRRILANVRSRGTFGEVQAETLLEQFLSPEQFTKNAQIKDGSLERVEFAIKLPGRDTDAEVLLPVDAKFPTEDYERLVSAAELGDKIKVAEAAKQLESRLRTEARTIREKYIAPPRTTDFAILFLATESLFGEVLRIPGLFEQLQRDYHITLAGPTTFTALLNALQMGFRSLAIEKRSAEVWQILGAVSTEFGKYNEIVDKLARQLSTAATSVERLGQRTRAMNRKLRGVERLPDTTAEIILGPSIAEEDDEELDVSRDTAEGPEADSQAASIPMLETSHVEPPPCQTN